MSLFMRWLALFLLLFISGCAQNNPVIATLQSAWTDGDVRAQLRAGYEYLQVDIDGHTRFMALGLRRTQASIVDEYWYSASREMIHLHNGRLVQAVGLTREIRDTSSGEPAWSAMTPRAQVWVRTRDLMPDYQIGVHQFVISQQITPTASEQQRAPTAQRWIQEQVKTQTSTQGEWIYDEWYALNDADQVIYSHQCIAPDLCLSMTYLGEVVKR